MVKCQVVMEALEKIAPRHLAEEWDNVGLLVGSPAQEVHKIIVALDVSETLVDFAVTEKYDMIISHHPLLFKPMKQLRTDLPQGRVLQKLLAANIAVFAAHTNLDIADGGVNDVLAKLLGLKNIRPFAVTAEEELVKLVVFVPAGKPMLFKKLWGMLAPAISATIRIARFAVRDRGHFCRSPKQIHLSGNQVFWSRWKKSGWKQFSRSEVKTALFGPCAKLILMKSRPMISIRLKTKGML